MLVGLANLRQGLLGVIGREPTETVHPHESQHRFTSDVRSLGGHLEQLRGERKDKMGERGGGREREESGRE